MPGKKPATVRGHQPRTQNRFRERELKRAMRAAKASGMPIREITIDPETGRIGIVLVAGEESPGAAAWDEATEKLQTTKRRSRPG
jgi:hypothetical protein